MLIVELFTKYFLFLMVIQGLIVGIMDAKSFAKNNMKNTARKARVLGFGFVGLGVGLFLVRVMI